MANASRTSDSFETLDYYHPGFEPHPVIYGLEGVEKGSRLTAFGQFHEPIPLLKRLQGATELYRCSAFVLLGTKQLDLIVEMACRGYGIPTGWSQESSGCHHGVQQVRQRTDAGGDRCKID